MFTWDGLNRALFRIRRMQSSYQMTEKRDLLRMVKGRGFLTSFIYQYLYYRL